MTSSKNY